jgi:hypothetical protein
VPVSSISLRLDFSSQCTDYVRQTNIVCCAATFDVQIIFLILVNLLYIRL